MKMKLTIFTDTYWPEVNGVALSLQRWVNFLEERGHQCQVFAPSLNGGRVVRDGSVIRYPSFSFPLYKQCKLAVPVPWRMMKMVREFAPDLIHVATPFNIGLCGRYAALSLKVPFVASYHTHFERYLPHYRLGALLPVLDRYMRWFHQHCDKIFVPSPSTKAHLERQGYKRVEVKGNGVDLALFQPHVDRTAVRARYGLKDDHFILLFVGRLAPEKGIDVLLNTFHFLPERIKSHSRLVLVGEGPLYEGLAKTYGNGHSGVHVLGFRHGRELADIYAASDLFVFPSATETFGNVVLEAMASGIPVIGANAGGICDNIRHMRTGWLCQPGDVEQFRQAVVTLHDEPELRRTLAQAGLSYSRMQSWPAVLEKMLDSCLEVIEEKRCLANHLENVSASL